MVARVLDSPIVMPKAIAPDFATQYAPRAGKHTAMLTVEGDVTFREAPQLRRKLFSAMKSHPERNLVVELSGVDRFDTAAMAVLLEGLLESRNQGPEIYLVGASEPVIKVFRLAGFEDALLRCFGCMDDVHEHFRN